MKDGHTRSIRDAIAAEEYSRAIRLWDDYVGTLQDELSAGRLTEARLEEARQLVEWARQAILAMRAHGQQRLDLVRAVREYDEHAPAPAARLVETSL